VTDIGPEMRSKETPAFMALVTIGQHFRRPSTRTDQAWVERGGPRRSREPPLPHHLCHSVSHPGRAAARSERNSLPPLSRDDGVASNLGTRASSLVEQERNVPRKAQEEAQIPMRRFEEGGQEPFASGCRMFAGR
jgi:hypothetical protein